MIFKDIFVSQGGMRGDGKALPPASGMGGGSAKTNFFDCLGFDLSTHFSNVKQAGRAGVGGSCGPPRQNLKGLAPGLTEILDN